MTTLNVIEPDLLAIQISPANVSLPAGASQQYSATGIYSNGSNVDVSEAVQWASDSTDIIIDNTLNKGLASFAVPSVGDSTTATITAELDGVSGTTQAATLAATVTSISVNPRSASLPKGTERVLSATALLSDGSSIVLTSDVNWTSADNAIALVSATGTVSALSVGNTLISAGFGGQVGTADIRISNAVVTDLQVTPANFQLGLGSQKQLLCAQFYSDGHVENITSRAVWTSKNNTVASVTEGLVSARLQGQTEIHCEYEGRTASSIVTVSDAILEQIIVEPLNKTLPLGLLQQYTATGVFSDQHTEDLTRLVSWQSADLTVASVNADGQVQALGVGATIISAHFISEQLSNSLAMKTVITGQSSLSVSQPALSSIQLTPAQSELPAGSVLQYTATAFYTDNSSQDVSQLAAWSSSDTSIVDIVNTGIAGGKATLLQVGGPETITAVFGGLSQTAQINVSEASLEAIVVTPAQQQVPVGLAVSYTAKGVFSDGSQQDLSAQVNWQSDNTSIATVNSFGLATGQSLGTTAISASIYLARSESAVIGRAEIEVTVASPQSLNIVPQTISGPAGTRVELHAVMGFSDGSEVDVSQASSWLSLDSQIAIVAANASAANVGVGNLNVGASSVELSPETLDQLSQSGAVVLLLNTGDVDIVATYLGVSASAKVSVLPAVLDRIEISPLTSEIPLGAQLQYQAVAIYSNNTVADITEQATWQSSDVAVATIDSSGKAVSIAEGSSNISASFSGEIHSAALQVTAATVETIQLTPQNVSGPKGGAQEFTATAYLSDGSDHDITVGATWASSNNFIASVTDSGYAQFINVGSAEISASFRGAIGKATVSVDSIALQSLQISPPTMSLPKGLSQQYSALAIFSDGSQFDVSNSVAWSTSDNSVASINPSGKLFANGEGFASVNALFNGVGDSAALSVTAPTLEHVTISPSVLSGPKGYQAQLTLHAHYSDGDSHIVSQGALWSSANEAVATVVASGSNAGWVSMLDDMQSPTTISAHFEEKSANIQVIVSAAQLLDIEISPASPSLPAGETLQFNATGIFTDGTTAAIDSQVFWRSSEPNIAVITSNGIAQGIEPGTTSISVNSGGIPTSMLPPINGQAITVSTNISTTSATLLSIEVLPANLSMSVGDSFGYQALGLYSDYSKKDVTGDVLWSSSDEAVATVDTSGKNKGTVRARGAGEATIAASLGGIFGQTNLVVNQELISSIELVPVHTSVPKGSTTQWYALANMANGLRIDVTNFASWQSADTAIASVSQGVIYGVENGSTNISAEYQGKSNAQLINVTTADLQTIEVGPSYGYVEVNGSLQYTAVAQYVDGSSMDITDEVTWSVQNTGIATVSNAESTKGLVSGVSAGNSTVSATLESITGNASVAVLGGTFYGVQVRPLSSRHAENSTIIYQAFAQYADGVIEITDRVNWASSNTQKVSISNGQGTEGIAYTKQKTDDNEISITASDPVTNSQGVAKIIVDDKCKDIDDSTSVALQPISPSVSVAGKIQMVFFAIDENLCRTNITYHPDVEWFTLAPDIASQDGNQKGEFTGLRAGVAEVGARLRAKVGILAATQQLEVTNTNPASASITP